MIIAKLNYKITGIFSICFLSRKLKHKTVCFKIEHLATLMVWFAQWFMLFGRFRNVETGGVGVGRAQKNSGEKDLSFHFYILNWLKKCFAGKGIFSPIIPFYYRPVHLFFLLYLYFLPYIQIFIRLTLSFFSPCAPDSGLLDLGSVLTQKAATMLHSLGDTRMSDWGPDGFVWITAVPLLSCVEKKLNLFLS